MVKSTKEKSVMILSMFESVYIKVGRSYLFYSLFYISIQFVLVSLISFVHFLIEHDMGTIENWIEYHFWELIVISKLLAILVSLTFHQVDLRLKDKLKELVQVHSIEHAKVFFSFLAIFYVSFVSFYFNDTPSIKGASFAVDHFSLALVIGTTAFYLVDCFWVNYLFNLYDLKERKDNLSGRFVLILSIIFYLFSIYFHPSANTTSLLPIYNFIILLVYGLLIGFQAIYMLLFLLFVILPSHLFLSPLFFINGASNTSNVDSVTQLLYALLLLVGMIFIKRSYR